MNILVDTNILLNMVRVKRNDKLESFINPNQVSIFTTVANEAEAKSIGIRNGWGIEKFLKLDTVLETMDVIEITQSYIQTYVEIDTFSQRSNRNFLNYDFDTPRNMGKNDLWIASVTSLLGLELVTTDNDFDHLHNIFLEVRIIKPEELRQFF